LYPASKVLSYFFLAQHGEARETLQNLCIFFGGAHNPKTWIIMRNFRFDTGFAEKKYERTLLAG
jgi:hypothetical protein